MIGRGAQGRPWIFRELNYFLANGNVISPLEKNDVRDIMLDHLRDLYQFYGDTTGVRVARKHLTWYCSELQDSQTFRSQVVRVDSAAEQIRLTKEYFRLHGDDVSISARTVQRTGEAQCLTSNEHRELAKRGQTKYKESQRANSIKEQKAAA
jgi:hypothetical protein